MSLWCFAGKPGNKRGLQGGLSRELRAESGDPGCGADGGPLCEPRHPPGTPQPFASAAVLSRCWYRVVRGSWGGSWSTIKPSVIPCIYFHSCLLGRIVPVFKEQIGRISVKLLVEGSIPLYKWSIIIATPISFIILAKTIACNNIWLWKGNCFHPKSHGEAERSAGRCPTHHLYCV